ncbi:helix-turn-helix domain-containing protein [Morganella sp. EGD-HP17]|uniref:helix-turn-helix domain-containing protein n=1 Tax=Morganella sp. EGD-HP17 TaxID=1435146 RepID=UPI000446CA16|nr:helix-turn-helix transcriptional regulator [Morganella sp. EGD-HP17]ETO41266.1 hypothetical protein X965_11095 [Morganella sp. EGD-HP17]
MNDKAKDMDYLVGLFIRRHRRKRGMNGKEFSRKLNISHQQLSRYERGESCFTLDKLALFLSALDKDFSDLATETHWGENEFLFDKIKERLE